MQMHPVLVPMLEHSEPCTYCQVQVPDIYDSAKYDSIHNRHLGLDFRQLYQVTLPDICAES